MADRSDRGSRGSRVVSPRRPETSMSCTKSRDSNVASEIMRSRQEKRLPMSIFKVSSTLVDCSLARIPVSLSCAGERLHKFGKWQHALEKMKRQSKVRLHGMCHGPFTCLE